VTGNAEKPSVWATAPPVSGPTRYPAIPISDHTMRAVTIAVLFGLYEQVSGWSFIATLPVFTWEGSLGIYLIVNGFKPSPITAG
jgi:hypothetical protein